MDDDTNQTPPSSSTSNGTVSSSSSASSSSYTARVSRSCVHPPTIIRIRDPDSSLPASLLQYSLHTAPPTLRRELHSILPALALDPSHPLLLLPTFQQSLAPLTTFTPQTEAEKNRLLETFSGFARALCLHLTSRGYFADYIDPCTGHPALTASGGSVYSEVDGASALLRYRVEQAGSCSIVLHPMWGSGCYPASCVTNARVEAVLEGLQRVRRRWEVVEERKNEDVEVTSVQQPSGASSSEADDSGAGSSCDQSGEQQQQQHQMMLEFSGKVVEEEKIASVQEKMQRIRAVSTVVSDLR